MEKIVWTKLALRDVIQIHDYIAEDSLFYARQTIEKIFEKVVPLEKFPLMGRMVPEFNNENVREVIMGNYRIVYRITKKHISIVRVHHSARNILYKRKKK